MGVYDLESFLSKGYEQSEYAVPVFRRLSIVKV